jgi:hypothetical protein
MTDDERKKLLDINKERIEQAYLQFIAKGSTDPLIVALDVNCSIAKSLLAKVQDLTQHANPNEANPLIIFPISTEEAIKRFTPVNPTISNILNALAQMTRRTGVEKGCPVFSLIDGKPQTGIHALPTEPPKPIKEKPQSLPKYPLPKHEQTPLRTVTNFGTSEKLLQYLREHSDDIEKAVIPQMESLTLMNAGQSEGAVEVGMVLHMVEDRMIFLTPTDAEILLNDGILNRMEIKIELFRR